MPPPEQDLREQGRTPEPNVDTPRDAIVERMRRVRDDIQEGLFNAVAYVNAQHPHEKPIDPDPDGSMRRYLDALNGALTREEAKRNLTATAPPAEGNRG